MFVIAVLVLATAAALAYWLVLLRITLSSLHTADFRVNGGAIGGGIVAFSVDATGAPTAFFWSVAASTPSPVACGGGGVTSIGRL